MERHIKPFLNLSQKVQSKLSPHVKKVQSLNSRQQKRFLLLGVAFAALNLAYSLFSLYTLISFAIVAAGTYLWLKISLKDLQKTGLIVYLSPGMQKVLLQRSVFDIICDIWFIPRISIFIKALLSPFFVKIEPTDAVKQLKEFPNGAKRAMLTKGVVNILPSSIKGIMLPQAELVTDEEDEVSSISAEENQHVAISNNGTILSSLKMKDKDGSCADGLSTDIVSNRSISVRLDSPRSHGIETHAGQNLLNTSTDEDALVNHNLKSEPKKNTPFGDSSFLKDFSDSSRGTHSLRRQVQHIQTSKRTTRNPNDKIKKTFLNEPQNDPTSPLEKTLRIPSKPKVVVSETWDNLELFTRLKREKQMIQSLKEKSGHSKPNFKGPMQMLQNFALLMSKEALMNKLEDKKLVKLFLISTLALVLQFSISKKTRYWCFNTLQILMYIAGFTLSTGTISILMIKMKIRYSDWKNKKRMATIREEKEKEDDDK